MATVVVRAIVLALPVVAALTLVDEYLAHSDTAGQPAFIVPPVEDVKRHRTKPVTAPVPLMTVAAKVDLLDDDHTGRRPTIHGDRSPVGGISRRR